MTLTNEAANALAADLAKTATPEWARLRRYVRYARGKQALPWLPDNVESEYRDIAKKSASNWLGLVIAATAQGLEIDGYGDKTDDGATLVWEDAWQANGMDARQHALNRAVLALGYSHLFVFPSDDGGVWMRPDAATEVHAVYDDPSDEWPLHVLRVIRDGKKGAGQWELYDGDARYTLTGQLGRANVTTTEHGLPQCPVVMMRASLDLLGLPQGEVEPVISIQDRIVDATFTLQMVAKYGAFPQRWIAGIDTAAPLTDASGEVILDGDGNPVFPTIKAYVDHILTAIDPDTKFGQFAAADLTQYVEALEAHIRHLAAITQTPPHYLLGSLVNLSAEALAAAESGLQRKIKEKRTFLGEGYEQALRLAALILGDEDAAMDTSSHVHWQDVGSRSMAQTSDALLKLSQLGVPLPMLFRMIPGWTKTDADEAAQMIADGDPLTALMNRLDPGVAEPESA